MRVVRMLFVAFTAAGVSSELALIGRWAAAGITVTAIAAAVLSASMLAVMFGLS
jgi:hypothetical protein